jgi:hypothetical protein
MHEEDNKGGVPQSCGVCHNEHSQRGYERYVLRGADLSTAWLAGTFVGAFLTVTVALVIAKRFRQWRQIKAREKAREKEIVDKVRSIALHGSREEKIDWLRIYGIHEEEMDYLSMNANWRLMSERYGWTAVRKIDDIIKGLTDDPDLEVVRTVLNTARLPLDCLWKFIEHTDPEIGRAVIRRMRPWKNYAARNYNDPNVLFNPDAFLEALARRNPNQLVREEAAEILAIRKIRLADEIRWYTRQKELSVATCSHGVPTGNVCNKCPHPSSPYFGDLGI